MGEIQTFIEELVDVLSARERLAEAKEREAILAAVEDAVFRIQACDGDVSSIQAQDPPEKTRDTVSKIYDTIVPGEYERWWPGAKEEYTREIVTLPRMKDILERSHFDGDKNTYAKVRAAINREKVHGCSQYQIGRLKDEYDAHDRLLPITADQFSTWKATEINSINERLAEIQSQMEKMRKGAPAGFFIR